MQELTYAFPILSWLVFVPVIVALGIAGLNVHRLKQGEGVLPSMLRR